LRQAGKLSNGLRALGAEPVEVPVLEIGAPLSFDPLDEAIRQFAAYDWLVLTSSNTVRVLVERAEGLGVRLAQAASLKVAAIGGATAIAARDAGFILTFVPESYVAESLVEGLGQHAAGQRVLLARAAIARDVIPDALRAVGAQVDVVDAYRNAVPAAAPGQLRLALEGGIDAATFTSSSSASHLAEVAGLAGVAWPLAGVHAVSIGPITSQTLRDLGWPPAAEAVPFDISGLIDAAVRVLSGASAESDR
jgi:uroporphyrinogen-III synthase